VANTATTAHALGDSNRHGLASFKIRTFGTWGFICCVGTLCNLSHNPSSAEAVANSATTAHAFCGL
jgi:hypothetical protein